MRPAHKTPRRRERPGLSLVEAVISIALVGGLLIAAANTLGTIRRGDSASADRVRGMLLARALMDEIFEQPYYDPSYGSLKLSTGGQLLRPVLTLGPDTGESTATRTDFDDVDDYHGWSESPPQAKNGSVLADLTGWTRTAKVELVSPLNIDQVVVNDSGLAKVTVTVKRGTATMASLSAVRGVGLPPASTISVLMPVINKLAPSAQETARRNLLESWDYSVTLINDSENQASFDAAVAAVDVAYVPPTVSATLLGTKLRNASCAVLNEHPDLTDELGLASSRSYTSASQISIADNSHDITAGFALGLLATFATVQPVYALAGSAPPQTSILAHTRVSGTLYPSLLALESGWILQGGGLAANRRVQLPWGSTGFDFNSLTSSAHTLLRQAFEWAAAGQASALPVCGNALCQPGEDCVTCLQDCPAKSTGPASGRYCCGNGILESAEGNGSICGGNP